MIKYEVLYYNRFACETQRFFILAKNEEDARRIFYLRFDISKYKDCIEEIFEYKEPYFIKEEDVINTNNVIKRLGGCRYGR